MESKRPVATVLVLLAALSIAAGTGTGQSVPAPTEDDLGVGGNDVREEPSNPDDGNGFPDDHEGPFWSPKDDTLILDAGANVGHVPTYADVDNLVNRAQHGENYDDHERTMYPGPTYFEAWWGWWSDTGGGGDLQTNEATSQAPGVGEPNGAIDDANDCDQADWDEFTWRGDHPCPDQTQHPAYPDDQMFGFIQPGTHAATNNELVFGGPVETLLDDGSDDAVEPDFAYFDSGLGWGAEAGQGRYTYDSSILISTSVASAVNPRELGTGQGINTYDPFEPADDPEDHAVDVDVYTTPHPTVEEVYRTAVWDPDTGPHPDRGENVGVLHEDGLKGWAKDDGTQAIDDVEETADENVLDPTEPQAGLVNDLVQDPFFHEPNQPGDDYNGWATHDAATSYGGLEGDYYEPGDDQAYPGYQDGERFWVDAQVTVNKLPWWFPFLSIGYDGGTQLTPQVPSPSDPAGDAAREDSTTQGPGVLYMHAHAGTWYDGDEVGDRDTWIGDAPDDPYGNGTVQDPNAYEADESVILPRGESGPEWRGTCGVDIDATLYPTSDTDGDGVNDWGAAGVYVMGSFADTNPYSNVWMDVVGPDADPVLDPLRGNPQLGFVFQGMFPEDDERLTRYRTDGPIEIRSWNCRAVGHDVGFHPAMYNVILPTGTLDFTFKAVTNATLTDQSRVGQHGDTDGTDLAGATITDVDRYGRILPVEP